MKYTYRPTHIDEWLPMVSLLSEHDFTDKDEVYFDFSEIPLSDITPVHIVTFACLIEHIKSYGTNVLALQTEVSRYFWNDLNFRDYWTGGLNFVRTSKDNVLNLWRIVDAEKETHSINVRDYLKQHFFKHKDLSAVKNSLDEAYYNIFDHAIADGNAFSFIRFDENTEKLFVAVCDFGVGIATLVKPFMPKGIDDSAAIIKAMERAFTTKSQAHNRGYGLDNIISTCTENDEFCIIANRGQVIVKNNNINSSELDYYFPGTVIYYELSLSHFPDEEDMAEFTL